MLIDEPMSGQIKKRPNLCADCLEKPWNKPGSKNFIRKNKKLNIKSNNSGKFKILIKKHGDKTDIMILNYKREFSKLEFAKFKKLTVTVIYVKLFDSQVN